jgi:caspase 7
MSEIKTPLAEEMVHTIIKNGKNLGRNGNNDDKAYSDEVLISEALEDNVRIDQEITIDQADAWGFGGRPTSNPNQNVAVMPCEKDSELYNMNHRRRGLAIVFNHKNFDPRLGLKTRNGTDADRDNLRSTLRTLDFAVKVYNDLPYKEMERILEEASNENHADADCILVAVLSHGELGILYSCDQPYKPDRLWGHFNAEKCPTLAGKPKLFFVQACQGDQLDTGVHLKKVNYTETDSNAMSYKIPSHADFLIAYSTIPGFYSWRNTTAGSWFVQALCYVLQRTGHSHDLLSNLTRVARKVAFDFQSNTPGDFVMHEKKQIPCITSMLTRDIIFTRKV